VYVIIAINVAVFIMQEAITMYAPSREPALIHFLALSREGVLSGFLWQFVTFQFLHGDFLHILVNMLVIFFIGREMEMTLGRMGFLTLYLASGVLGGVLQVLLAFVSRYFDVPVIGASAGAAGLVAAFATLFPQRHLTLLLFFVLPVSFRARTLLWIAIGISLFGILIPSGKIAHAAHMGGILGGVLFVRHFAHGGFQGWFPARPRRREVVVARSPGSAFLRRSRPAPPQDLPPAEFISREVDPILDKISAHGIHSLTERERHILEAARARMGRQ
jgi:membrane associated rhomboid family serine protease